MKAHWIGTGIKTCADLTQPGDIGIGAENYHHDLLVICPLCESLHVAALTDEGGRKPWGWNQDTLTLTPSYKCWTHNGGICHWNLTNGEFVIHGDSVKADIS